MVRYFKIEEMSRDAFERKVGGVPDCVQIVTLRLSDGSIYTTVDDNKTNWLAVLARQFDLQDISEEGK